MDAHKEVARDAGVERQLCGENGDLFFLAPTKGIRRQAVDTGRVGVERGRVVRLE